MTGEKKRTFKQVLIEDQWLRIILHVLPVALGVPLIQLIRISWTAVGVILGAITIVLFPLDALRWIAFRWYRKHPERQAGSKFYAWYQPKEQKLVDVGFVREGERRMPSAVISYVSGLFLLFLFPPKWIALAAAIILATGDPAARLVGIHVGGLKLWKEKTLAGFMGFFTASTAALACSYALDAWCSFYPSSNGSLVMATMVIGALTGAITELVCPKFDNFFVGVVAASTMWAFWVIGGG